MKHISRLTVSLESDGELHEVGELAHSGRKIYFKYYPRFMDLGIEISPLKLPLSDRILTPDTNIFDGLFGVFNDSLPDGWGRLLLDRKLLRQTGSYSQITPLDRLASLSPNSLGALSYQPTHLLDTTGTDALYLDDLASESQKVLSGTASDIIDLLFSLGGSSGGARPKIFVGYHPGTGKIMHDPGNLPEGYEHWIIKFPASNDPQDIAQIEHAYYKMAVAAGLQMSPSKIFYGNSGRAYFGTKRFDREGNRRIHLHSASGIMHDNFRLSNMDYGHLLDCAFRLEKQAPVHEKVFRLAAFNLFAHNRDDHSKNVSFLMTGLGTWSLAPAYDLTFSNSSHGFHSLTFAGEGKNPTEKHLLELAKIFSIKNAKVIISEVRETVSNWKSHARDSGVSPESLQRIHQVLAAIG